MTRQKAEKQLKRDKDNALIHVDEFETFGPPCAICICFIFCALGGKSQSKEIVNQYFKTRK